MKHCVHATEPLGPLVVLCANPEANKLFGQRAHVFNCDICAFRQPDPASAVTIADAPDRGFGLGDLVEKIVKPIARIIKSDCLDKKEDLVAGSPCAKRRDALNRAFPAGVAS
jgi:hypothetical protein